MDLFSLDASPAKHVKRQTKVNYSKLDPDASATGESAAYI